MRRAVLLLLLLLCPIISRSEALPFVSRIFSSNMVLQRDMPIPVWGWTTPNTLVDVSLGSARASSTSDSTGRWRVELPSMPAGGPYTLEVSGPQTATFNNVMLGDVWLCSGQSNMQYGVGNLPDAKTVEAAANYPDIRLYTEATVISPTPLVTPGSNPMWYDADTWQVCSPDSIAKGAWSGFSAVGYFFGRDLYKALNVPIGLIHSSWGGTVAESWTSATGLSRFPEFTNPLQLVKTKFDPKNPNQVTVLYNGMIAPIIPFPIKGVVWYQGESNVGWAQEYRKLLPALISDWRSRWGEGDFPFYIVQIAPFTPYLAQPGNDVWSELREAQTMTAESVPNSGLALTIDIGNPANIHPTDKKDVGKRLALIALAKTYHEKVVYSGPVYTGMDIAGSNVTIHFRHTSGGLKVMDNTLAFGPKVQGFAIAGADKKWYWAHAKIVGNTVVVSSSHVPNPVAVRYAYAACPVCNLYNGAGLPAVPFRTDHWAGISVSD